MRTIDFEAIRAAHPLLDFCASRGIELRRSGGVWQGKCPLHNESKGASFTVWPDENRWKCFGACSKAGDIVDLVAALDGIDVPDAAKALSGGHVPVVTSPRPAVPKPVKEVRTPYVFTSSDRARMNQAIETLLRSEKLCRRICAARGWDETVVRDIALNGDLGWEGDETNGKLLFEYAHGIKARWREGGERRFAWLCGGPHGECWRQWRLDRKDARVVIAEGETDVISLLCAGMENDGKTVVVGLPGASGMPDAEPFRGRAITIFPDNDTAGAKSAEKLARSLNGVARSVRIVKWPDETKEAA